MTGSDLPPTDTGPLGTSPRPLEPSWFDLAEPVAARRWEVRLHDAEILDRWRIALEAGDGREVDRIVSASRADRARPSSRAVHDTLLGRCPDGNDTRRRRVRGDPDLA